MLKQENMSTEHRDNLLKYIMESNIPLSTAIKISEPMKGKPDRVQEEFASSLLRKIKNGELKGIL